MELNCLIFSKNRACQLDSLLKSLRDNFKSPFIRTMIVYKATDESFKDGYQRLIAEKNHGDIEWIKELSFKNDMLNALDKVSDESFLMFLVDDNIMFRPFDLSQMLPIFSKRHLFISLRCSRTYKDDIQPKFIKTGDYLEWSWTFHSSPRGKWNYPFSVDGNIFHKKFIQRLLRSCEYKAPNSLESALHAKRHALRVQWRNKALAPLEAVVFNNPLNKVQTEGETWHMNLTAEQLNKKYLEGYRINNRVIYAANPSSAHFAVDISFIKDAS